MRWKRNLVTSHERCDVPPVSGVVLHLRLRCWLWTRKHPTKWWRSMSKQRIRWHAKLHFAKFRVDLEIFIDFPGDPAELFVGGGHGSPFLLGHALWLGVLDEICMKSWNHELMNGIWRLRLSMFFSRGSAWMWGRSFATFPDWRVATYPLTVRFNVLCVYNVYNTKLYRAMCYEVRIHILHLSYPTHPYSSSFLKAWGASSALWKDRIETVGVLGKNGLRLGGSKRMHTNTRTQYKQCQQNITQRGTAHHSTPVFVIRVISDWGLSLSLPSE